MALVPLETLRPARLAFHLPLNPARLLRARQRIRDYLDQHLIALDTTDRVILAIEEAMTNSVRHSGSEAGLEVSLRFEGRDLLAVVADHGRGFDVESVDYSTPPDPLSLGGRGLFLISKLMDEVELTSNDGTQVRMRKHSALGEGLPVPSLESGIAYGELLGGSRYRDQRTRSLVDELGEGFAAIDWEFRFTYTNQIALQLYAKTMGEILGRTVWELFPHIEQLPLGWAVRDCLELGVSSILEVDSVAAGQWIECRVYPTSSGASLYLRDIQARKLKELAHDEARRRAELLADTAGQLLSSPDPQGIVEDLCTGVMAEIDCQVFFNFLVDDAAGCLHLNAYAGIAEEAAAEIEWLDYGVAVCGCAARDACRVIAEDIPRRPDPRTDLVASYGITAYACHPLIVEGKVLGTLSFGTRTRTQFSEDDLSLMKAVADHVAIAMQRLRSEEGLRESEERFRWLLETSRDALYRVNLKAGRYDYISASAERLVGYTSEELMAMDVESSLSLVHPDDLPVLREAFGETERTGEAQAEYRQRSKKGGYRWLSNRMTLSRDDAGAPQYRTGNIRDITARKQAEEALAAVTAQAESERERLALIIETIPSAVVLVDGTSGKFLYVNRRATELYGVDYAGFDIQDHIERVGALRPDGRPYPLDDMPVSHSLKGEEVRNEEMLIERADGSRIPLLVSSAPLFDERGEVTTVVVVFEDISDRKRAEETLRESRSKHQALVEAVGDFIWEIDAQGRYTYCSPQMESLWGLKPEEMIGRTPLDVMPPEERERMSPLFQRLLDAPQPFRGLESRALVDGGRLIHIETSGVPYFDEDGSLRGLRGVSRDITERKLAEEALRASEERVRIAKQATSLGVFDHDVRSQTHIWDERCRELWGLRPDEPVTWQTFIEGIHPEDRQATEAAVQSAFDPSGTGHFEMTYRVISRDGTKRSIHATAQAFFEDGQAVRLVGTAEDVTERKRIEEALGTSEEHARHLIRYAAAGIYEIDFRGPKFVSVNDFMCTYSGYSREELLASNPLDFLDEESQARFRERIARTLGGERVDPNVEYCFRTKQGEQRWCVLDVTPTFEEGRPVGAFVVGHDVTEHKRAEEALRDSRARYRALIETTSDFIWEMDAQGRYTYCSPQMETLWGLKPEEMIGKSPLDVMPAEDREEAGRGFQRLLGSPQPLSGLQTRALDAEGRLVYLEINAVPFFDTAGGLLGFRGITRDISERKKAEEALRASDELRATSVYARSLIEASLDPLVTVSPDGKITDVNCATEHVTGVSREELIGTDFCDYFSEPEVARQGHQMVFVSGSVTDYPLSLRHRDGHTTDVLYNASLYRNEAGEVMGVFAAARDVTELKRAERAALESARRFERQRHIAETLQANLVHPLPSISGLELAALSLPAGREELVGGDFHDVFQLPDGLTVALIGDVVGKGIAAAGATETVRSAVRALASITPRPEFILRQINRMLLTQEHHDHLITALILMLDPETGQGFLASAGHSPPIHLGEGGPRTIELDYGLPLGSMEWAYGVESFVLNPGETLLLYTDGVTEARRGGDLFGEGRLLDVLGSAESRELNDLIDGVRHAILAHAGELKDDVEILALRRAF